MFLSEVIDVAGNIDVCRVDGGMSHHAGDVENVQPCIVCAVGEEVAKLVRVTVDAGTFADLSDQTGK